MFPFFTQVIQHESGHEPIMKLLQPTYVWLLPALVVHGEMSLLLELARIEMQSHMSHQYNSSNNNNNRSRSATPVDGMSGSTSGSATATATAIVSKHKWKRKSICASDMALPLQHCNSNNINSNNSSKNHCNSARTWRRNISLSTDAMRASPSISATSSISSAVAVDAVDTELDCSDVQLELVLKDLIRRYLKEVVLALFMAMGSVHVSAVGAVVSAADNGSGEVKIKQKCHAACL